MAEEKGVWRTVRGRRVFIREGEDLASAMARSGKFRSLNNKDKIKDSEEYKGDISDLKGKHTSLYQANRKAEVNNKIRDILTGKSRADKGIEKYGYKVERDDSAQKEFGKRYFGKNVTIKNERTGKEIHSNYNNYFEREDWISARPIDDTSVSDKDLWQREHHRIKDYKVRGDKKPVNAIHKFDYENYLDTPVNKLEGDKLGEKVAQFKADKKYLKDKEYEAKRIADTGERYAKTKYEIDKFKERKNKVKTPNEEKTPYNSKEYAKWLSKSYMAGEEYNDKTTPKYIQDIEAGRYGNMTDEDAIKNWIDGGADIVYIQDAENLLKQWGVPVKNDDAFGTYKEELTKQLLPIYKEDKLKNRNTGMTKQEEEYQLYKRAKINPDSIDPMTENSTDWETLNKKYASRYNEEVKSKIRSKAITVEQENELESAERMINDIKNQKIDKINVRAENEYNKEAQRILQKPTVAEVRKTLRNMNSWSDEYQYGNIVVTKTGNTGYHIRNVDDVADPMTDYFPGVYGVKEKQVLKTLEEKGFIVNNKDTNTKIERFRERKGTTRINKTPTKRELAERIVDSQIERGTVKRENREMQIKWRLNNMTKDELEKASSFFD